MPVRRLAGLESSGCEVWNPQLRRDWPLILCPGCSWEREKTHHQANTDNGEKEEEPADADGEEAEASEPPEVALAREEVNLLLAEQRKTAALKVRERDVQSWAWC